MSPLSSTSAYTATSAYARADASNEASRVAAAVRAAAKSADATNEQAVSVTIGPEAAAAVVRDGLSTAAVTGSIGSLPAALGRMRDVAMAAGNPALTDADRATLQAEYADLSRQVASVVGSVDAGESAKTSADKDKSQEDKSSSSSSSDNGQNASPVDDGGSDSARGAGETDRAVRSKTGSATSTVNSARSDDLREAARGAVRASIGRAAGVAQFQQHSQPQRSHISLTA